MAKRQLELTRAQVLAFRRRSGGLDQRLPPGPSSLRAAAWAGLQDSMPRAALLSIHARVEGTEPDSWEDPSLVQVWGPRFSAYVVAERDRAVFTLGRLPDHQPARRDAEQLADQLEELLDGRSMKCGEAGTRARPAPELVALCRADRPGGDALGRRAAADDLDGAATGARSGRRSARARLAGTSTSSDRRPRTRSPSGPGSRQPRGSGRVRRVGGIADAGPHARRRRRGS